MAVLDFMKPGKGKNKEETLKFKRLKTVVDKFFDETQEQRDEMSRYLRRYKGEWWDESKLKDTDSTIVANLMFSTVMTIAPLITDNRPIWSIRSRKPYLQNYFDGLSLSLEYLWDKLDMDALTFKWILDALIMKVGVDIGPSRWPASSPRTIRSTPRLAALWHMAMHHSVRASSSLRTNIGLC